MAFYAICLILSPDNERPFLSAICAVMRINRKLTEHILSEYTPLIYSFDISFEDLTYQI